MAFAVWIFAVGAAVAALYWALKFYREMMTADEGTELMREIAESVRVGAKAYLNEQYRIVTYVFIGITILLGLAAYGGVMSAWTPVAFLTGGFFSGLCGWFGMKTATQASGRTASAASRSLNEGLQIAFRSGAVMGLTVVGLGLLYICIWFGILYWVVPGVSDAELSLRSLTVTMLSFGMGASAQALFARVGGGIFTKAADVGADLVGKVEESLSEDSPKNPATIADNVGDNVGDVAGMGADLYESYCGSILAASALGVAAFAGLGRLDADIDTTASDQLAAMMLPIAIAAAGILASIVGVYAVKTDEDASQKSLLHALDRGIRVAALIIVVASVLLTVLMMPRVPGTVWFGFIPGVTFSILVGLLAGVLIGKWTERVTSDEYAPTQKLADQAKTGPATIIIGGVADGMMSVWVPVLVVCAAMLAAFALANGGSINDVSRFSLGLYGVGIAAVGMLSTLGITLATDAYGPIADNAGGNAEMSGLEDIVRQRTDALDSLGNTTAATGKGFAIGSAALTALALLAAYIEGVREGFDQWGDDVAAVETVDGDYPFGDRLMVRRTGDQTQTFLMLNPPGGVRPTNTPISDEATIDANVVDVDTATLQDFLLYFDTTLMNPRVLVGLFIGAMSAFMFCAMTMKSVGRAAQAMVVEVRNQFLANPGILKGETKPDYQRPITISTRSAQKEMILPSVLGLVLPIATGLLLGVAGVLGLLVGCLSAGFCLAVFMSNAGGSWDNAKKYIEAGNLGGKGSDAHKAAVVGDTVGDPFKDTSGPSLNILIKLMSMVSVVVAGLVVRYSIVSQGWF